MRNLPKKENKRQRSEETEERRPIEEFNAQNKGQASTDGTDSPSVRHKEQKQDPHHGITVTKFLNTWKNRGLKDHAEENASHMQRKGFGHIDHHTGGWI